MTETKLHTCIMHALEDAKARDIKELNVSSLTSVTELMIIASGTSKRHVKAIADRVVEEAKEAGHRPLGVEGQQEGEWVLVDIDEVVVHVMLPRVRDFYNLEKLWAVNADAGKAAAHRR